MIAALFDVEGTLYTNQMGRGLLKYAWAHGRRGAVIRYYVKLTLYALLRLMRLVSAEQLRRVAIAELGRVLAGWRLEEANGAFDWIIHQYTVPTARSQVLARLAEHRRQGHHVLLVSGMPTPCLATLGKVIGATAVIGTDLAVQDGRYTGSLTGPVMVGEDKRRAVLRYAETGSTAFDWQASFAYADSIHDRALFEMVGHPVAVSPDEELLALAKSRGWEIMV